MKLKKSVVGFKFNFTLKSIIIILHCSFYDADDMCVLLSSHIHTISKFMLCVFLSRFSSKVTQNTHMTNCDNRLPCAHQLCRWFVPEVYMNVCGYIYSSAWDIMHFDNDLNSRMDGDGRKIRWIRRHIIYKYISMTVFKLVETGYMCGENTHRKENGKRSWIKKKRCRRMYGKIQSIRILVCSQTWGISNLHHGLTPSPKLCTEGLRWKTGERNSKSVCVNKFIRMRTRHTMFEEKSRGTFQFGANI